MDKSKDNFGSRFLYAEDLLIGGEFKTVQVVIEKYYPANTLESADRKKIDKPSLGFKDKAKLLVLCKTNSSLIHFVTGEDDPAKWVGKTITLQPRVVDAFGEKVVALRVMPTNGVMIRKGLMKRLGEKAVFRSQ